MNDIMTDKNTTLHKFAQRGFHKFVNLALEMGANINAQNSLGNTPLHLAVLGGHTSVIKEIAKRNTARIDINNNEGDTVCAIIQTNNDKQHYLKYLPPGKSNDRNFLRIPKEDSSQSDEDGKGEKNKQEPKMKRRPILNNSSSSSESLEELGSIHSEDLENIVLETSEIIEIENQHLEHMKKYSMENHTNEENKVENERIRQVLTRSAKKKKFLQAQAALAKMGVKMPKPKFIAVEKKEKEKKHKKEKN